MTESRLWRVALAPQDHDKSAPQRERLRSSLISFRERAGYLANEIRVDLSQLTVHDLTHLDALWEMASIIVGPDCDLTPTEAYVFGGAVLLHDLAMSLAAIEGGLDALRCDPRWADLVTSEYQTILERDPGPSELKEPDPKILRRVLFNLLRQIHAENAEKLAFLSYRSSSGSPLYLIEDTELRQTFGGLIGRIAHSHWWGIEEVENQFTRVVGAPYWSPAEWRVDPLKIACMLRTSDAAHLDARRAPTFLKAMTKVPSSAVAHWTFQEKLNKPYLREDALVFTSGAAFSLEEASSWWLCMEALKMVDRELRTVDALLADGGYSRFAAKSVAGVDVPDRLASFVQTDGWLPIDATVQVSDLPNLVKSIGGEELYGKRPQVGLRELVQNACDAVRARRAYEHRGEKYGKVEVSIVVRDGESWLEVADNGIGMSQRVLTEFLLDFGKSFWSSPELIEELPGVLASGVKPTGRYGIGFFSVFMLGDQAEVVTRRPDHAAADTLVLEFSSGVYGRPTLRKGKKSEQLIDGGTVVRIKLLTKPEEAGGLLYEKEGRPPLALTLLCARTCPAVDVDLYAVENGQEHIVVRADDWKSTESSALLCRMKPDLSDTVWSEEELTDFRQKVGQNLRLLTDDKGDVLGRACIVPESTSDEQVRLTGVITVGGLKATEMRGITGVMVGHPLRASRDAARPTASQALLRKWAEGQVELIPRLWTRPDLQASCAQYIRLFEGDTEGLPIAIFRGRWYSADELRSLSDPPDVGIIASSFILSELQLLKSYRMLDEVFVVGASGVPSIVWDAVHDAWPALDSLETPWGDRWYYHYSLEGAIVEALAIAWKVPLAEVVSNNDFEREREITIAMEGEREIKISALQVRRPA